MVNYTLIGNYTNMSLTDLFGYPTTGDPYFYVYMVLAFVFIMASTLYYTEVNRKGQGNFLSSLAVACFAGIVLVFAGSLIGLFTVDKVILMFILQLIPIALWWFGQK